MDNDKMTFDEVELNVIYTAICQQIKRTNWDVSAEDDWELLKAHKALQERIGRFIDGED